MSAPFESFPSLCDVSFTDSNAFFQAGLFLPLEMTLIKQDDVGFTLMP
jgi:hypothetical protein